MALHAGFGAGYYSAGHVGRGGRAIVAGDTGSRRRQRPCVVGVKQHVGTGGRRRANHVCRKRHVRYIMQS